MCTSAIYLDIAGLYDTEIHIHIIYKCMHTCAKYYGINTVDYCIIHVAKKNMYGGALLFKYR